jgi:AcrR family transcriptional regulator
MQDNRDVEVRKRIIHACTELFGQHGFGKITMDEVARALGMSKKTVYKHFSGKEEIVRTIVINFRDETLGRIEEVSREKVDDPVLHIRKILETLGDRLNRIHRPFVLDIRRYLPELWEEIDEFRRDVIKRMFNLIFERGREKKIFRSDIDEEFFMHMYVNSITSMVNPEMLAHLPYSAQQIFHNIIKIMFEGSLTDEARAKYQM